MNPPESQPEFHHVPVLLQEVLAGLNLQPGRLYVDATLGGAGHSLAILEQLAARRGTDDMGLSLVGIDQDPEALSVAGQRLVLFGKQCRLLRGNFSQISRLLTEEVGLKSIDGGLLADLGVSSPQLDQRERGFSFRLNGPLDMRMDPSQPLTAQAIVNTYSTDQLVDIFSRYGEARMAKTIARAIVSDRERQPFETTKPLADLIERVTHHNLKNRENRENRSIHPATQCFQAIRIEVNQELAHLEALLAQLPDLLAPGARVAIISFHSLEDRLVKRAFQAESRECICPPRLPICQCQHKARLKIISNKPITATPEEIQANPRARSAKLRVAERLSD